MNYVTRRLMILLAASLTGCRSKESLPPVSAVPYDGPPVTLEVRQEASTPPTGVADVTITVPTGGWSLNFDGSRIESDLAIIELTLEQPRADEMVTQSFQTLTKQCLSAEERFTRAEARVRLIRRGDDPAGADYRLAATAP